jgi:hypothetical protein
MPGEFDPQQRQSRRLARRRALLAGPVLVPVSMAAALAVLGRLLSRTAAAESWDEGLATAGR